MNNIILKLIALENVIGELCDLARIDERQATQELLLLENRIVKVIHDIMDLLDPD